MTNLFGKLNESLRGTRFENNNYLANAAKQSFRHAGSDFYNAGIQVLVPR